MAMEIGEEEEVDVAVGPGCTTRGIGLDYDVRGGGALAE